MTFLVMLGYALAFTSVALGRVVYLVRKTPSDQGKADWILMTAFLTVTWIFWAFQIWRIIIRF
ncbi:MAG: hypothetical protein PHT36_00315 [Patescibacteria group bacterium]|nr:hypothetical protein [Patescibacteria group bacterium]